MFAAVTFEGLAVPFRADGRRGALRCPLLTPSGVGGAFVGGDTHRSEPDIPERSPGGSTRAVKATMTPDTPVLELTAVFARIQGVLLNREAATEAVHL